MNEWKKIKIKDICSLITEKTKIKNSNLDNYISTENMLFNFGGIIPATKIPTTPLVNIFKMNDILFSNIRTYFKKVWYALFDGTVSQDVLVFRANRNCDNKFLYYLLCEPSFTEYTVLTSKGAKMPRGDKDAILNYSIFLPQLPEQKSIASVLSSIDDKIDLLHRQNKTLESMAETLFRQWFIEDNQELWEEKSLSEIAVFTNGLACQKYPASVDEKGLPVLKIKELQSGFSNTTDIASSKVNSEYIVHHGDIIFAWSASLMVKIWSGPDCVLNQHLFNVKSDKYPKWFYYEWCKYHLKEFINISQSHATTMGHIRRKDLDEAIVKVPPDKELSLMSKEMIPILNQRIEKMKQILTLENLRDTLLPKLMSGEVRVKLD